ncbi:hypothetical protein FACS189485_04310 [Spirochaetia bacterium]|nr:hypothetical protein FACS189485_04310 [Spirochaetia bacterium]
MLHKKIALAVLLVFISAATVFGQASALRDYVGIIKGTYHPDALEFFDKLRENYKKRGKDDLVKWIDGYIKSGVGGTGFVYVAPDGENYVITNYHVVAQTVALSISFEKLDGAKTTYDRLKVAAADEDIDIAVLTFADGAKPFTAGLAFITSPAEEGADVFAAGFPGMFTEQIWQFSKGVVSNARMRLPHDIEDEEGVNPARWGPYIQHTSNIDHGNSGGPLLVQQADVTSGYAVAGINTLTLSGYRENTFFAIPADRALAYIGEALKPKDEAANRHNLDLRLDAFIKGLAKPKAVYGAIADYLSNGCTASNAEYAIIETFSRAPRTVQDAIDNVNNLVDAMNYCVAWIIEDTFRGKTAGTLRATLGDITQNTDGSYTVPLQFSGDHVINTTWVSEFGIWKLDKAGDLVTGDKTLVEKRAKDKESETKLRTNYALALSAGYAYLGLGGSNPRGSALDVSMMFGHALTSGVRVLLSDNFGIVEGRAGYTGAIRFGKFALMPYGDIGVGIAWHEKDYTDGSYYHTPEEKDLSNISAGLSAQVGLKFTTSFVPGLFLSTAYQFSYYPGGTVFEKRNFPLKDTTHGIIIGVGYLF